MGADTNQTGVTGRDYYAGIYGKQLEAEAEWLRRGAPDKADSVEQLLARNGIAPRTLTELGAGTGAVISECRRRGLGETFTAIDDAAVALEYLQKNVQNVTVIKADIASMDFRLDEPVDVLVISHVVEHLEQPKAFLEAVRRLKFKAAIIEVPLEDLPLARYKAWITPRSANVAGHVQFFTVASFERLVTSAGLKIVDRRSYVPTFTIDTLRFVHAKDKLPFWRLPLMWLTRWLIPRLNSHFYQRLYHCHYAILVVPA
jgi:Methyltransferase domain